ncbi:hypothetical protein [Gracilibacillus salitolerans]|uniref:hypothetical protein n=1 Tax=Gracilibacillus salitolerans TaxID=2663022 RepID=UPI0018917921|nr:hypothetical protein [Gracilibacillus salitolerans]
MNLGDLGSGEVQLVEAVVSHQSTLLSNSFKESQFRSRYDAEVLVVHRNNEWIKSKLAILYLNQGKYYYC